MGKWAKPDLSDLENDLLNNAIQVIRQILRKLAKSSKTAIFDVFRPFGPWKMTFRAIQSNPSFDSSLVSSLGSFMHNRKKVIKQFLRKLSASKKEAKLDLSDLLNDL